MSRLSGIVHAAISAREKDTSGSGEGWAQWARLRAAAAGGDAISDGEEVGEALAELAQMQ